MSDVFGQVATKLLFENRRVRVWELSLDPGQSSDWHRHDHDYLFVNLTPASTSLEHRGADSDTRALNGGFVQYVPVGPRGQSAHRLVNVGDSHLRQVLIEFLGPSEASHDAEPEDNGRYL